MSRPGQGRRIFVGLWGLGFHEYRERWLTDDWHWYQADAFPETAEQRVEIEDAQQMIEERQKTIAPYTTQSTQTRRGKMFDMLADLVDEDGAWAEMQDLPDWLLDDNEKL